ncbi:hypothetical protein CAPTEDRAFT_189802 [Capitella teleta]|uniref:Aftiphilin clathrin-binding box domain-containing protein n=1 Tax=Capitella teleta TaxID=283909 RepID=R7UMQ9_CAPTE|nr:hypothetical protein CAPTEDRAFT_189802 [Capitella teleta]|eukprot:ELU04537.1 hypothetical protein CAPTEDRAFT_189802 [Capitella teleta]
MSNVIPIVSSSPPPMDDGSAFNAIWDNTEEADDDFGGFTAAAQVEVSEDAPSATDHPTGEDEWTDFGDFDSNPVAAKDFPASAVTPEEPDTHSQEQDTQSQGSISDSGLSSDISPGLKFDDLDGKSADLDFNELQWDPKQQKSATLTSSDSGQVMVSSKEGIDGVDELNPLEFRPASFSEDEVPPVTENTEQPCDEDGGDEEDWLHSAMDHEEDQQTEEELKEEVKEEKEEVKEEEEEEVKEEEKEEVKEEEEELTFRATNCDSSIENSQHQHQDEEDDFADFEVFRSSSPVESEHSLDLKASTEPDSEWNAFEGKEEEKEGAWATFAPPQEDHNMNGEFSAVGETTEVSSIHLGDDDDEFGDFGTAATEDNAHNAEDDFDDFDDFESAAPQITVQPSFEPQQLDSRINAILSQCFERKNESISDDRAGVQILSRLIEISHIREEKIEQPNPAPGLRPFPAQKAAQSVNKYDANVWNNLKSTETTPALKYHWADSCMQAQLLTALGIDTRNILMGHKKQSAPVFAPNLGMLEPTRGDLESSGRPAELMVDTTAAPTVQAQDIPMPDFDWGSSGLTNPLDGSSTVPLDLDFFVTSQQGSVSLAKSEGLQKEKEILQALEPSKGQPPKSLQPLENLLATMKFTPTTPASKVKDDEELSSKGREVILGLPNLSFMHAKVLMFRLGASND